MSNRYVINDGKCRAKDPANCEHPNCPGGSSGFSQEVQALLGVEHKGFKGAAAIDKLLEEKNGHVKNAFNKKGIGYIDLIWGDDDVGLQHIIERRSEQGFDGESFLSEIPKVIQQGRVRTQGENKFAIEYRGTRAVVATKYDGNNLTFLLTAFETD